LPSKIELALAVVGVVSTTQMIMVNPAHAWRYGALAAGSCNQVSGRDGRDFLKRAYFLDCTTLAN
jgi:hypothetical protein